jgi:lamin tail-like protein
MRRVLLFSLVAVMVVAVPAWASAAIKIAKIQYDPPGTDSGSNSSLNQEYVVIKNIGTKAATLTGWTLRDQNTTSSSSGRSSWRQGSRSRSTLARGLTTAATLYWGSSEYVWNNDGDRATLKTRGGHTVDTCSYSGGGQSVTC